MNSRQSRRRKELLFHEYNVNLRLMAHNPRVRLEEIALTGILCPLCLQFHDSTALKELPRQLTLDHIPPESSGGNDKDTMLVCTKCNNEAGYKTDHHLVTFLKQKDVMDFIPGSEIDAQFSAGPAKRLNGTLSITGDRAISWHTHRHRTNPATVRQADEYMQATFRDPSKRRAELQIHLPKPDQHMFNVALLRIAYLIYFRWFGYAAILHPHFESIRSQILDPTGHHLPETWNVTGINKGDDDSEGVIFMPAPAHLRCVLMRFSLTSKVSKRTYLICLPSHLSPGTGVYQAIEDMRGKEGYVDILRYEIPKALVPIVWSSPNGYQLPYKYAEYWEPSGTATE